MIADPVSRKSVNLLAIYCVAGAVLAAGRLMSGSGAFLTVALYLGIVAAVVLMGRVDGRWPTVLADWMPLLALPALYAAIPTTALVGNPFDRVVQHVDRIMFGSDVAHSLAAMAPSRPLSELLHAAYLSYYAIIYGPPVVMYLAGNLTAFRSTIFAFTIAMVGCFALFCVFPVEGPRYVWSAPPGVPAGFFRHLATLILERGSSRGTAFPSSHQAIACVMTLSSLHWNRWVGAAVTGLTVLLGIGAVYAGFHYATDMLTGGLVGMVSWWIANRLGGPNSGKVASA